MEDNPYQKIIELMDERGSGQQRTPFRVGTVKKTSPLTIEVAGTDQSGNLWKNATIGNQALTGITGWLWFAGNMGPSTVTSGELNVNLSALAVGDSVLLLAVDDQAFYIICKAVRA